jgi:hypothetical protein
VTTIAGVVTVWRKILFQACFKVRSAALTPALISTFSFLTAAWYTVATIAEKRKAKWIERKERVRLKRNVEQYKKKQWEEVKKVHKQIDWETGKRRLFE